MVETISPVVHGTRTRWLGAVALHALGAAATAAAFGAAVAAAGGLLGAPWGRAGAAAVIVLALAYLGREVLGLRLPVPQLARQVPDWWRTYFGRPFASFLYGAGLGIGFLTFLGHGTLVAVAAVAAASGRPSVGAILMAPFGVARGLSPLVAGGSREPEDGRRLVDRLAAMPGGVRSWANAVALLAVGAAAGAWASSTSGGWGEAAAAALALVFGWAAVSKAVAIRRWRRTLDALALPAVLGRPAVWLVPLAESLVTALTVVGRVRSAAGIALALLLPFTIVLLRSAIRDGRRVPCGCFGRAAVDVRAALLRNLVLAGGAFASWSLAGPDPALREPVAPEVVPVLLMLGAVAAAALTAWRATAWLGRGRA